MQSTGQLLQRAVGLSALVLVAWSSAHAQNYGNSKVESIELILGAGARPKFTPDGKTLIFDRRDLDGFYGVYLSNLNGVVWATLGDDEEFFPNHTGNPLLDPASRYFVFIAQARQHFLVSLSSAGAVPIGDPGVGLFSNLWATNGRRYFKLTDIPLRRTQEDPTPVYATVNPRFSPDGQTLVWTQRYDNGGNLNWGLWRLMAADFVVYNNVPTLENERVLFTPTTGNYVTAMDYLSDDEILVSGNLDGQHEFGMDLYRLDPNTGAVANLTNSPTEWEEGSCVAPSGKIVYMTNRDSAFELSFGEDWVGQPLQRDYYLMDGDGANKERLTYFNEPGFAESVDWNAVTIICDISPDGKKIAATVGRDFGDETQARLHWQIWMITLEEPL